MAGADQKGFQTRKLCSSKVGIAPIKSHSKKIEILFGDEVIDLKVIPTASSSSLVNLKQNQQKQNTIFPSARISFSELDKVMGKDSSRSMYAEFNYKDLEALKELNCPMNEKRMIRSRMIRDRGQIAGQSKSWADISVQYRRFKENSVDALNQMKLWESPLHEIEGRFGTGVRSYFAFLRWLFILNFIIFFLIFFFIVIPKITLDNLSGSGLVYFVSNDRNISAACTYNPYDPNSINNFPQYILWWFTGQGFMENTLLFAGYYDNVATVVHVEGFNFFYNIPLAYLVVAFFYFFISLVLIVRKAAQGLRESLTDDGRFYTYFNQIFNGWDYCINDEKAAQIKHRNIKNELEVELEQERIRERQAKRTRHEKLVLIAKRIFINILVIGVLFASLFAIFFSAQFALRNSSTYDDRFLLDLLVTYLTSIVMTMANFAAPVFFAFLVKFEDYSPDFSIRFTLARTILLRLASIVFLYVVVYFQINCHRYTYIVSTPFNSLCGYCVGLECWETYMGQEMYKLTVLDFFIVIGDTLFAEFPRKLVVEYSKWNFIKKFVHLQEFSIIRNVLSITYSQTLLWIGAFYAPLLPLMASFKFFVFFYVKKLTLLYNCQPAARPYKTSRSGSFFYVILLFGFAVALFPVAISVAFITPSKDCGPFRNWPTMFYAVTASILSLPTWAQDLFWFFGSSGFAFVIVLILCLVIYYFYSATSAHNQTIKLLKHQLILEGKDKQFLLKRMNQISSEMKANASRNSDEMPQNQKTYERSLR